MSLDVRFFAIHNASMKGLLKVNELEKVTKEKLDYAERFIEKGGSVNELHEDKTFLEMFKKENDLIYERNREIDRLRSVRQSEVPRWAIYEDGKIQTYCGKQAFHSESEAEYAAAELNKEEPLVNHEYYVDVYPLKK